MSAERGKQSLLFLSPVLHFKTKIPAALVQAKGKVRKEEKGLVTAGHTGSQLLIQSILIKAKLLHSSTASGVEFTSEMKILAVVWDYVLCSGFRVCITVSECLMLIIGFYPHKIIVRKKSFIPILGRQNLGRQPMKYVILGSLGRLRLGSAGEQKLYKFQSIFLNPLNHLF